MIATAIGLYISLQPVKLEDSIEYLPIQRTQQIKKDIEDKALADSKAAEAKKIAEEAVLAAQTVKPVVATVNTVTGSITGNLYSYGYCTWYVKNLRPDLPNDLGNADTWYIRYTGPKGSEPRAGAVGVARAYMHVVYVNSVNADGSVNISEMNYAGWNVASTRTTSAAEFLYIY